MAATTRSVSKPSSTALRRATLRITRAAETRSTRARATSTVSSVPRQRRTDRDECCRSPVWSDSRGSVREACRAGARPKRRPVASVTRRAKARTRASRAASASLGVPAGARALSPASSHCARASPATPPRAARSRLSTRRPAASRPRAAPRATHTESSRLRPSARTTWRFATLRHAMARTAPTAPSSRRNEPRTSRTTSSSRAAISARTVPFVSGYACRQPLRDGPQLGAGLRKGRARPQPGHDLHLVVAPVREQLGREGRREENRHRASRPEPARRDEPRWEDTHHAVRLAVEADRPAENARVRPEPAPPQGVREDHDPLAALAVFLGQERTAQHRPHAEDGEEVGGHRLPEQRTRAGPRR